MKPTVGIRERERADKTRGPDRVAREPVPTATARERQRRRSMLIPASASARQAGGNPMGSNPQVFAGVYKGGGNKTQ